MIRGGFTRSARKSRNGFVICMLGPQKILLRPCLAVTRLIIVKPTTRPIFSAVVPLVLCFLAGCQVAPETGSYTRPEIKIINYVDVPRRDLMLSKSQFSGNDSVAVCVQGFAGRTVTVELWEQRRGRLNTWTQAIRPAYQATRSMGMAYSDQMGNLYPTRRQQVGYVEMDWVLHLDRLPPGNYEVRLTSSDGVQQQNSFSVFR